MNNKELFPLQVEQPEAKSLKNILSYYLRYWYLFAFGILLALGIAFAYLQYYAVPRYQITSTVLVKDDDGGGTAMSGGAIDLNVFRSSKNLNNEIEILKSAGLMHRVVRELDLGTTYYVEGRFRNEELYNSGNPIRTIVSKLDTNIVNKDIYLVAKSTIEFQLFDNNDEKGITYRFGQLIHKPYGSFTIVANNNALLKEYLNQKIIIGLHDTRDIAENFSGGLTVSPIKEDATVLRIGITDAIPSRGIDIVNKLVQVYNKEALEDRNVMATNTITFLDDRLKYITGELSDVEKSVAQYKSSNELTDVTTQASNYVEQATDYNKRLSDWAIQIDILESIENYLNQNKGQYKMVPSTLGIQDETLLGLINKFNELQLERERMLRTTEVGNPLVQNFNEQLSNLRANILENLGNIKKSLVITSNSLKASSGQFKSRIQRVPRVERELQEINRQQETKQKLYLFLLQRREEAAISLASTVSNSRIIDTATSTNYPISPSKQIIYLTALLLGALVPFGILYTKDLLNDKIRTQQDVERLTTTPILGELAHNSSGTLVVTRENKSTLAEMFRLIRSNLSFAAGNAENGKVILVTSSMSGEGKTFFAINLGASLVLAGKRTLLIELDLRNPSLLYELGEKVTTGLTDYINSNEVSIKDIIQPIESIPHLDIIGAGTSLANNPAELMMSDKLQYLISELKDMYDHIIIDTAPIGRVSDAFSLRTLINQTIYLVRYNYTDKRQINIISNIFSNHLLPNPMIVLNDAKKANEYGYGHGYGYEVKKKRTLLTK
ncbi:polysaccharide biosynthesis tyrosine autokinase [Hymenobacter sp. BT507]|uniref:non-specific protein-tyrosine kinase n=1 Tax=Hymenobacter citatus TaxID=2763506 RepID=A0ABR7MGW0_9BACT|nr:tyrosine-protein kinase family protein [Hymenobacter citatus]MBC6610305.1 polysaccharide biosynthesis tyrosine autokinase [Hymenobacter citatus]